MSSLWFVFVYGALNTGKLIELNVIVLVRAWLRPNESNTTSTVNNRPSLRKGVILPQVIKLEAKRNLDAL